MLARSWRSFLSFALTMIISALIPGHQTHSAESTTDIYWQAAYAAVDPEAAVFGPKKCGDPCVVRLSNGGIVGAFMNLATLIRSEGRRLVIDGPCISACAIMADFARPNVCITRRATFEFHMATEYSGRRSPPPASPDIDRWVMRNGGYPLDDLLVMNYQVAKRYWPTCTQ